MTGARTTAAPTGRKKPAQGKEQSGSGVPPLNPEDHKRRDAASTLGHESQSTLGPEGAKESGELPKGWRWVTLGDVAESMKNGIYKPASSYADDGLACLRMYNIGDGKIVWRDIKRMRLSEAEIREYELLPGDLLVNRVNSRELVGKSVAIPTGLERCVFESKNIRVRIRRDLVSPEFVSFRLLSAGSRYFTQNAQQVVGMASISQPQVARFPLPLPPLPEQRRIVAEIEKQFTRLEAGVAALRRVQANLKRYRAAVLKAACEGRLVPTEAELHRKQKSKTAKFETGAELLARILTERRQNWQGRGQYKEPAAPDTANLPTLPEGWTWVTVEQLGRATTGFTPPKNDASLFGGGIPFFKPSDLDVGYYVREFRDSLTEAGAEHGRVLPPLSILVTCIGATIGKTGFARVRCTTNQQINALTVPAALVSPQFVYWCFSSPFGQRQIIDNASATTLPILNKSRFEALPIPLPPLAEQTRIVAEVERRLSVVVDLESVVSANLQRATRLRQSILQKAFAGGLVNDRDFSEHA